MSARTRTSFVTIAIVGALAVAAPVAQAAPPDAFERAVGNHQAEYTFVGHPDAIDRALATREFERLAAIDARERALSERPAATPAVGPDAFERALVTHSDALVAETAAMLDARERSLETRPTSPTPIATPGEFGWSEFGVGAGAGAGLAFVLLVLGLGAWVARRDQQQVSGA